MSGGRPGRPPRFPDPLPSAYRALRSRVQPRDPLPAVDLPGPRLNILGGSGVVRAGRETFNTLVRSGVFMNAAEMSDGALVRRARDGDREAFSVLVQRHMRPAYAVALSVTRHHEDAEDVAQEAILVALRRLEQCRNPEKFGGWLMTIVRNRARNLLRRQNVRATETIPESASASGPGPAKVTERSELRGRLREALERLTQVQREVVLLHDLEGWKHREIAEHLGMPSGTVRSHLHYARKELRRLLGETEDNGDTGE